ncbi:hypothetical protein [Acinetobacter lwoffii]|uniref:hypothetical protein n=1 Tax=Acinetobacter lwoffii TaxID=28090 RepID=UPI003F9230C6
MDISEKQAVWREQKPLFEAEFIHSHLLPFFTFNENTGDYEIKSECVNNTDDEDRKVAYEVLNTGWVMWLRAKRDAKAQAVPEGFVLIKASDRDQEMLELIDQRDYMESQAEELKDKLQALYGVDFGEHSSCNFPFQNAIDYDDSDLVLVPREPNEKMIMNGLLVISTEIGKYDIQQEVRMIWEKMIEAQEPTND